MMFVTFNGIAIILTFLHTKTKGLNVFIKIKEKSFHF